MAGSNQVCSAESLQAQDYIDQLINEDVPEDSYEAYYKQYLNTDSTISHEIELRSEWRDNSFGDEPLIHSGIGYNAFKSTENFGDFLLNLTAFDSPDNFQFVTLDEDKNEDNWEISRYSLQQTRFPLTESIHMSNIIGTHRSVSRASSNKQRVYSRNFIGRRFRSSETDILGLTSRLFRRNTTFSLSTGELGRNRGFLLPGFEEDEGKVNRAQISQAFDQHLITGDLWQTDHFEDNNENRPGGRLTLDSILPKNWRSSLTAASSDDSVALLGGMEKDQNHFRQDFGAYFYDPDFIWINRRLGDDNTGIYYRFTNRNRAYLYGGSAELRQDGIEDKVNQKNTLLLNANLGYRINRTNRINGFYSYRQLDDLSRRKTDASFEEHRLRSFLSLAHRRDKQSTIGVSTRHRQAQESSNDTNDISLFYTYHQQLDTDSSFDTALEYTHEAFDSKNQDSYSIDLGWNKALPHNQTLRASIGYNDSDSSGINSFSTHGWHGDVNYNWLINDRFVFDAQIGYNTEISEIETANDISQELLTDLDIDNLNETTFDDLFIQLGLRYSLGGHHNSSTIARRTGLIGSGSIRGRVFIDTNGDGIFQTNDQGLANIEVFLDSVYPTRTDSDGYFLFRNVGIGNHYLFVDESTLPLPWSLNGKEFHELNVRLRKVNTLDISVSNINSLQ